MNEPLPVILERADALLDVETKRKHPALPFEDIRTQFPDQWVAIHVVTIGNPRGGWVGRIFAHGPKSNIVEREAAKIEQKNPAVCCSLYFTGDSYFPPSMVFVGPIICLH